MENTYATPGDADLFSQDITDCMLAISPGTVFASLGLIATRASYDPVVYITGPATEVTINHLLGGAYHTQRTTTPVAYVHVASAESAYIDLIDTQGAVITSSVATLAPSDISLAIHEIDPLNPIVTIRVRANFASAARNLVVVSCADQFVPQFPVDCLVTTSYAQITDHQIAKTFSSVIGFNHIPSSYAHIITCSAAQVTGRVTVDTIMQVARFFQKSSHGWIPHIPATCESINATTIDSLAAFTCSNKADLVIASRSLMSYVIQNTDEFPRRRSSLNQTITERVISFVRQGPTRTAFDMSLSTACAFILTLQETDHAFACLSRHTNAIERTVLVNSIVWQIASIIPSPTTMEWDAYSTDVGHTHRKFDFTSIFATSSNGTATFMCPRALHLVSTRRKEVEAFFALPPSLPAEPSEDTLDENRGVDRI
jgi:hypothetical protein